MWVLRQPPRCWPGALGTGRCYWATLIFRPRQDRVVTCPSAADPGKESECAEGADGGHRRPHGQLACTAARWASSRTERAAPTPPGCRPGAALPLPPPAARVLPAGAQRTAGIRPQGSNRPCREPGASAGKSGSNTRHLVLCPQGWKQALNSETRHPQHSFSGTSWGCPVVIA